MLTVYMYFCHPRFNGVLCGFSEGKQALESFQCTN